MSRKQKPDDTPTEIVGHVMIIYKDGRSGPGRIKWVRQGDFTHLDAFVKAWSGGKKSQSYELITYRIVPRRSSQLGTLTRTQAFSIDPSGVQEVRFLHQTTVTALLSIGN